jgi:hypothetical protein
MTIDKKNYLTEETGNKKYYRVIVNSLRIHYRKKR